MEMLKKNVLFRVLYFLSMLNTLQNSNSYNFSAPIIFILFTLKYLKDFIEKFCYF